MLSKVCFKRIVLLLLALVVPLLALLACGGIESAIVGIWKDTRSSETVEFSKGGAFIVNSDSMWGVVSGEYEFLDSNRVLIKPTGLVGSISGNQVIQVEISGDYLYVTREDGEVTEYIRVD